MRYFLLFFLLLFLKTQASASHRLPMEQVIGHIEPVFEFSDNMPTGVTVSKKNRIFVNFPRWGDNVPFTVGEIQNGKIVPYPNATINHPNPSHAKDTLISVQSVVIDANDRLWILDTGSPSFAPPIIGGAKLVAVDLKTNQVVKTIVLPSSAVFPTTYLNDVRFDLRCGKKGVAYVTDSSLHGPGAILVVDINSGKTLRRLSGHYSTSADRTFVPMVEGEVMALRSPGKPSTFLTTAVDGIALSADGSTLYYCPLSSRHLFCVSTALLRDSSVSEETLEKAVVDLGEKGASDGLEADDKGRIYAGDYENNSIRQRQINGEWKTIAHDPRILWPDTLSVAANGYLYFTANQLHRQPIFHQGKDLRQKPYILFRITIDAGPVWLK